MHAFLTMALHRGQLSVSSPSYFASKEGAPRTHG